MSLAERLTRIQKPSNILIIDIERLAGTAYAFDPKTRYIPAQRWITRPRTVCFAARWYGRKQPIFKAEWTGGMAQTAWDLYDKADIVVTYNGIRFDDKHLRSLWFEEGMPPPRPWKPVDLFAEVRRSFGWEFKSLDDVTRRLGSPGKQQRYDVWQTQAAVDGDKAAQRALRTYNHGDVELTEWLYDRLRGWLPNHPIIGSSSEKKCPQCASEDLKLQPTKYRAVVIDYSLYRCLNCGANVRGGWHSRAAVVRGVR